MRAVDLLNGHSGASACSRDVQLQRVSVRWVVSLLFPSLGGSGSSSTSTTDDDDDNDDG
jgi:hypothetical protein